ncbi:hypothetical protein KIN20_034036 [Parelaphostrongylus tenuis]|uniref:Uncharacterized protein n=1 Tax=Parelaphostrongylus tenuis TaxID=148309 RepID=A0AAD5RBM9_PARTN|nr:hypothetical protein KIN20_034036 [Parelaphostrongylus tenuis]
MDLVLLLECHIIVGQLLIKPVSSLKLYSTSRLNMSDFYTVTVIKKFTRERELYLSIDYCGGCYWAHEVTLNVVLLCQIVVVS